MVAPRQLKETNLLFCTKHPARFNRPAADVHLAGETALNSVVTRSIQELCWWPFGWLDPYIVSKGLTDSLSLLLPPKSLN